LYFQILGTVGARIVAEVEILTYCSISLIDHDVLFYFGY